MTLTQIDLSGYIPGTPSGGLIDAATIDGPLAEETPCEACGSRCEYRPYIHPRTYSYRAFAVCATCGHAQEF